MKLYTFKRLKRKIFLVLANIPMSGHKRYKILQYAGIQFVTPPQLLNSDNKSQLRENLNIYIGEDVHFDTIHPENITIGNNTLITAGTRILTHFYDTNTHSFEFGKVYIGNGVFIGMNTLICKPVTIGDNAVVGAGSIVTKDIPAGEIWAGNPARFIKKRIIKQ